MAKNSIRYRIMRSELEALQRNEELREEVRLAPGVTGVFSYELQVGEQQVPVAVHFAPCSLRVQISPETFRVWLREDQVGVYQQIGFGNESLELVLEKDFACLDRSDADNRDTFENPLAGSVC